MNLYAYVMNNPVNMTDPTGEAWWLIFVAVYEAADLLSSLYDAYTVAETVTDPDVSNLEKAGAVVIFAVTAGSPLPGGMTTAAKGCGKAAGKISKRLVNSGDEVTEELIRQAMKDAPLRTDQKAVSIPAIKRYVDMLKAGKEAPPIKVDNGVIIDGNHRYIAGRLFGKEPAQIPGTRAAHLQGQPAKSWMDMFLDAVDWGNK